MAARQVSPRVLILLALLLAAAVVLFVSWRPGGRYSTGGVGGDRRDPVAAGQSDPAVPPPLGLDAMGAERAAPANKRDLFRFGQAAPDPATAGDGTPRAPGRAAPPPVQPNPEPALPQLEPIPLRYVVFAETPGAGRVAGLSDGRFIYNAREGDVIEGKWRVVKIGPDAVIIERVDGTGRQTLRLVGG
ncbi:MAG: hypothetical protein WD690_15880 [Vicinamibacterales bacterium]